MRRAISSSDRSDQTISSPDNNNHLRTPSGMFDTSSGLHSLQYGSYTEKCFASNADMF